MHPSEHLTYDFEALNQAVNHAAVANAVVYHARQRSIAAKNQNESRSIRRHC